MSHYTLFFSHILDAIFPSTCICCGDVLVHGERQICLQCLTTLSATCYSAHEDNHTERLLTGRIPFVHATSIFFFQHNSSVQKIVHDIKFHSNSDLCLFMGRQMGLELMHSGRFDDIDLLVPVPLHWLRRLQRGYNQSELLCRGIGEILQRPVNTRALVRHRYTRQQSRQIHANREQNVQDAFHLRHPDDLRGKHILLVDDVLTTGATLVSCCDALSKANGLRISIATLTIAS